MNILLLFFLLLVTGAASFEPLDRCGPHGQCDPVGVCVDGFCRRDFAPSSDESSGLLPCGPFGLCHATHTCIDGFCRLGFDSETSHCGHDRVCRPGYRCINGKCRRRGPPRIPHVTTLKP